MPKRFFDTHIFRSPLVRSLDQDLKLFWIYLFAECDHAGVWIVDPEIASIHLNTDVNKHIKGELFGGRVVSIQNGARWFIPSFIRFQYKDQLNIKNKVHKSAINILSQYPETWGHLSSVNRQTVETYKQQNAPTSLNNSEVEINNQGDGIIGNHPTPSPIARGLDGAYIGATNGAMTSKDPNLDSKHVYNSNYQEIKSSIAENKLSPYCSPMSWGIQGAKNKLKDKEKDKEKNKAARKIENPHQNYSCKELISELDRSVEWKISIVRRVNHEGHEISLEDLTKWFEKFSYKLDSEGLLNRNIKEHKIHFGNFLISQLKRNLTSYGNHDTGRLQQSKKLPASLQTSRQNF